LQGTVDQKWQGTQDKDACSLFIIHKLFCSYKSA